MSTDPELQAMSAVAQALDGLDSEAQVRVIKWVSEKKGLSLFSKSHREHIAGAGAGCGAEDRADDESAFNRKAAIWMKQNSLTSDQLDQVFFFAADGVEIIAPEVPGKSTRERTINAYVLAGVVALLRTGSAEFTDQAGRDACKALGCLDPTNHAKYLAEKGNLLAGSKERGWSTTPQGLKHAASLIKEIAGGG